MGRGGAREGAGRKSVNENEILKPICFKLGQSDIDMLKEKAKARRMNQSEFIRDLIKNA